MMELLKNAWKGWLDFMGAGKMSALFLLGLLVCAYLGLGEDRSKRELFRYSGVMAALCICPFTAVLFMLYQTKFYDYEWIWSLVPMAGVIACCEVLFLEWFWRREQGRGVRVLCMLAALLALNLFSSSMGNEKWRVEDLGPEREKVRAVVSEMMRDEEEIVLWAPEEIVRFARGLDGNIKLLYGRNLWQEHLNAYSYDTYPQEVWKLFAWMEMAGRYGRVTVPMDLDFVSEERGLYAGSTLDGRDCVETALRLGADHILVPGKLRMEEITELAESLSLRCDKLGEYYLLKKTQ